MSVTFSDLSGAAPPFLRTGTLDFETGDPSNPSTQVPLEAYVNIACVTASQWIYTVDGSGRFARFDPATLTFTDIGVLSCPDPSGLGPFSMAVDQNAVAWVLYQSGNLFQVDTTTAACQATSFTPNQGGLQVFGMSFVFQPTTGIDTRSMSLGDPNAASRLPLDLATISFPLAGAVPDRACDTRWRRSPRRRARRNRRWRAVGFHPQCSRRWTEDRFLPSSIPATAAM